MLQVHGPLRQRGLRRQDNSDSGKIKLGTEPGERPHNYHSPDDDSNQAPLRDHQRDTTPQPPTLGAPRPKQCIQPVILLHRRIRHLTILRKHRVRHQIPINLLPVPSIHQLTR